MCGLPKRYEPVTFACAVMRACICVVFLFSSAGVGQQIPPKGPVLDESVEVMHIERMAYPLVAKMSHIQGTVVLRGTVDSLGQVSEVSALSGPKALLKESMENLKKWRFARPRQDTVVAVYWFRFSGLCELPCLSGFEFYPPNLVVVTTGNPIVTE